MPQKESENWNGKKMVVGMDNVLAARNTTCIMKLGLSDSTSQTS